MQKPLKLLPVLFASAFLAAHSHADVFGSGANQFSLDFVNIGNVGNAANNIQYDAYTKVSGFNDGKAAPMAGYGSVTHDYRMGKYEVTIDQFLKAANTDSNIGDGVDDQYWNYWNDGTRNVGQNAPVTVVSWQEAARFANWLSSGDATVGVYQFSGETLTGINRAYRNGSDLAYVLPTEDEWYKAAYYDNGYSLYSDGSSTAPDNINGWNYATVVDTPIRSEVMWETGDGYVEQNGTYDMMGNVWEWTETAVTGDEMVYRGGSAWADSDFIDSETLRASHTMADGGGIHLGFRVAAIPEPSTIGFMAAMGVAVFGIRRIFSI